MRSAFDEAVWVPGQPLDPGADTMTLKEVTDRLLFLEKATTNLEIGDIPMSELQKQLEQSWLPDAKTLFASGAIGNDSLAFSLYYAQVNGTNGALTLASNDQMTGSRASAGNYTINYPSFKATPIVGALPQSSVTGLRYGSKTQSSVNVLMSGDSDFDFWVIGK